jgi:hypothetical protein
MKRKNVVGSVVLLAVVAVVIFTGCVEEEKAVIPTYQIVEQEDISYLNTVRLSIRVVVPSNIAEQEVKDVAGDVVKKVTKSQDVNAIGIFMYDRIEDVDGVYTVASVDWAPYGDWARADEVKTGDYSKHQFSYEIVEK